MPLNTKFWIGFVLVMLVAFCCAFNMLKGRMQFLCGKIARDINIPHLEVLLFSSLLVYVGRELNSAFNQRRNTELLLANLTYSELSQWRTCTAYLMLTGVVLLVIWAVVCIRYRKKSRIEREESCRKLYSLVDEGDLKRFFFLDGDYASALNGVRSALARTKHWSHYEPRLLDVILNKSDLDNMLDIMLAGRGRIRSDAVMTGYSADSVDVAARVEFLQVLQSMLGSCGVTRPLFAIQHRDSGEILRYAWADTPAAERDHFEKRVPIDR